MNKKIEKVKRKNGYKSFPRTLVEAIFWDREKKPLEEVIDGINGDKISYPAEAGTAGQVLATGSDGKPEWVDAAEGGTYDGALSSSSTNAPQNKVVTGKLTELEQEVGGLDSAFQVIPSANL